MRQIRSVLLFRRLALRQARQKVCFTGILLVPVLLWGQVATTPAGSAASSRSDSDSAPVPAASISAAEQASANAQNPFLGSIPHRLNIQQLSLKQAIEFGLQYNLGLFLTSQNQRQLAGARLHSLSRLLPNLQAGISDSEQQINLAALGFPGNIPGVPQIVGPFNVFDVRGFLSQRALNLEELFKYRSNRENENAARYSYLDARDLVVLAVGGLYLQAVAGSARIDAVRAEFDTAQALFQQAVDMNRAGVVPRIDVLRSQVEMQTQQQRLLSAQNDFEKQKLSLARAIGLETGQSYSLSDKLPFAPAPPLTIEQEVARAYQFRADYQSAQAQVKAAELAKKAARGERLPSIDVDANYGTIGNSPVSNHGTFAAGATLTVPVFQGGKARADILQADAVLQQRRARAEDLRGRIEYDVRSAFLDLQTAAQQVSVAQSSVALAGEQLAEAKDRFAAGVADTIEVVQAEENLAGANDNFVNSVFAHNLSKLSLARAVGVAEKATMQFLGGK
jgi:outer membrane protein TolC